MMTNDDKYRWHDLRENPDDLPDYERYVYVYLVHRCCDSDGYYDYDLAFLANVGLEDRWIYKSSKTDEYYKVIAWKKNEPFE